MTEGFRAAVSFGGPLLLLVCGWGIAAFVPSLRRQPAAARAGWAYLLGAAWTGVAIVALSVVVQIPIRRQMVLPVLLVPPAVAIVCRGRAYRPSRDAGSRRHLPLLAAAVVVVASSALFAEAVTIPVRDWDGRMTWMPLARWMRAAGTVRPVVLTDGRWWVTHPHYPPGVPATVVALQEALDLPADDRSIRPFYAAFFPAAAGVLYGAATLLAGPSAGAGAVLLFASAPFVAFENHGGAAGAYCDLPLAAFFGAGVLLLARSRRFLVEGAAAGLLLGAAVLAKNEGTPLAAVVVLASLALGAARRAGVSRLRGPVVAAVLVAASVLLLTLFRAPIPNRFDEDYGLLLKSRASLSLALHQWGASLRPALVETFRCESWGVLFVLLPVLLLAGRRGMRHPAAPLIVVASLGPTAVAAAAYSVSFDVPSIVSVTWSRLLLHGLLPLLALAALALRDVFRTGRTGRSP